jgi:hypothetical protein
MGENDPLDALFVKPGQVEGEQRALLASLVLPFASIEAESGVVHYNERGEALNARLKVLVFLLARLALANKASAGFAPSASPKEIEEGCTLPGGTVRPALKQLAQSRLAIKSSGKYMILPGNLRRAQKELEPEIAGSTGAETKGQRGTGR